MKIIRESIKNVVSVLSSQNVERDTVYRRSSFCVVEEIGGDTVAYNSLTGEVIILDGAEKALLKKESLDFCEAATELIEKWYLVPLDHDDIQLCDEVRSFLQLFDRREGIYQYTILTTMDCNARCFYCFELGRLRLPMSDETALKTAEFIISNCKGKPVVICWFGGEPLFNQRVIDIIIDKLIEAGIKYKCSFVSNGYLFDQPTVDKAKKKWNTHHAQITIDGTQEVYNRTKAFINSEGKNPFAIVMDNIERLLKKGISVSVRMNMGTHNKADLFELVDWLAERFKGYDNIKAYPHLLFDSENNNQSPLDNDTQLEFAKDLVALEEHCIAKGLYKMRGVAKKMKLGQCMADSDNSVTVNPNGTIGKCEHFSEDEYVGNLDVGITDAERVAMFKEAANSHELCEGCASYPVCIQLKKCPDAGNSYCNAAKRYIEDVHLRRRLINTYNHYITTTEKDN